MLNYSEATKLIKLIKSYDIKLIPVGGYRRKGDLSDLDFLTNMDLKNVESKLNNHFKTKIIKEGNKYMRIEIKYINKKIPLDFWKYDEKEKPFFLFHYTGPKSYNIRTRAQAERLGYKLSQHGLFKGDKKINIKTEKELLHKLNLHYRKPENRE